MTATAVVTLPACGEDPTGPVLTVAMAEFSYAPAEVVVPRDSKVLVRNDGAQVHNWIVKDAGVGTAAVQPGGRFVLDLKGIKPGRYVVYCDQVGHAQAGQTGVVTISAS